MTQLKWESFSNFRGSRVIFLAEPLILRTSITMVVVSNIDIHIIYVYMF